MPPLWSSHTRGLQVLLGEWIRNIWNSLEAQAGGMGGISHGICLDGSSRNAVSTVTAVSHYSWRTGCKEQTCSILQFLLAIFYGWQTFFFPIIWVYSLKKYKNKKLNCYESCTKYLKITSKLLNFQLAKTMTKEIQTKTRIRSTLVHQHPFFQ